MDKDYSHLKPGDRVIVDQGRYGGKDYRRRTVKRVTPTGVIVTDDDRRFRSDGWEIVGRDHWGGRNHFVEETPEVVEAERRNAAVLALESLTARWKEWPTDRIEHVADFVRSLGPVSDKDCG